MRLRFFPLAPALCLTGLCCGRSPMVTDNVGTDETGGLTGVADTSVTGEDPEATLTANSNSGGDTSAPGLSCREILECVVGCLAEGDATGCVAGCSAEAEPDEGATATSLVACVVRECVASGVCGLAQLDSPECLACIGWGLAVPRPPGCEAEAAACR
ncbi:MAG: hypothetical protein B7733_20825 [Myxococcales bacterium FL481]|nr:MAG: hypothetical protein B7733_20825 [Myxococcales bacterium FL481]